MSPSRRGKRRRSDERADANATPATAASARPPWRWAVFSGAGVLVAIVVVLFALALPDALARTREGARRDVETPCELLEPTTMNARLGRLPAPAPDFTLKDVNGRDYKLSQFRGQVVLVNFWATWCKTCTVEMAAMERLVERMKDRPFRLLAVSVDEGWEPIRQFFPQGSPLEILLDTQRSVPSAWGSDKFPESFLIDRDGNIRYYLVSNRDWDKPAVDACIEAMLR